MGKLKVFFIILIVAAAIAAAGIFFFEKSAFGSKGETKKKISAEELAELSLDTDVITTNLASPGNFGIVQFNILLSSKKSKLEAEKRTPEIRAAIISTIAGFTKDELIGTEGITKLEEEMSLKLGGIIETGRVKRVLVTELKVQ